MPWIGRSAQPPKEASAHWFKRIHVCVGSLLMIAILTNRKCTSYCCPITGMAFSAKSSSDLGFVSLPRLPQFFLTVSLNVSRVFVIRAQLFPAPHLRFALIGGNLSSVFRSLVFVAISVYSHRSYLRMSKLADTRRSLEREFGTHAMSTSCYVPC